MKDIAKEIRRPLWLIAGAIGFFLVLAGVAVLRCGG